MWERIARVHEYKRTPTLVLLGPKAVAGFESFGPRAGPTEITTFHTLARAEAPSTRIHVLRIRELDAGLVKQVPFSEPLVLVFALSWQETSKWPTYIAQLGEILGELSTRPELVLTTTDYDRLGAASRAAAALNTSLDVCHQYLRASALRLNAVLAYSTEEESSIDAVLMQLLNESASDREPEQFHGSFILIYGGDSQQKILALNPDFDFEAAFANKLVLPAFTSSETHNAVSDRPTTLPDELAQIIAEFAKTKQLPEVSRTVLDGADDKKVISEFFTTLAQRST